MVAIVVTVGFPMMITVSAGGGRFSFAQFVMPSIVVVLVIGLWLGARARRTKLVRLFRFARDNKITFLFDQPVSEADERYQEGMIFGSGHSRKIRELFRFPDGTEIANYQYVTGSGKNRQEHNWGFARFTLPRRVPHMILDARKNNFLGTLSNLPVGLRGSQRLSLEGDFDKYYTLYAPDTYKRDALYVFTPDVMAAVIDTGAQYDIELIDDHVYLYSRMIDLTSAEQLEGIMNIVTAFGAEVSAQSSRYADERINNRTQDIIAEPGRRLKQRTKTLTIITIVVVVAYYAWSIFWPLVSRWLS